MQSLSTLKLSYRNKYFTILKPLNSIVQWLFLCLLILATTILVSCNSFQTKAYSYPITPEDITSRYMQINLLGSIALNSGKTNSLPITELSGLAWDEDEQLLYAVSDEGFLYHLAINIKNNKLVGLKVISAVLLKDKSGMPLKDKYSDSEGLAAFNTTNDKKGDSQLIISFENKPRISRFSPQGKMLEKIQLKEELQHKKYYRHKNKALESVAIHPKHGIITAAEHPLKANPSSYQTLYSNRGKEWHFMASAAENSAITGLEVLANGDVLILERAYVNPLTPIVINLRRLKLNKCNKNQECETEIIARFDGADGWLLDNFEGLTHFRGNQYLMVSDNNNNPLQTTILVLFEIANK